MNRFTPLLLALAFAPLTGQSDCETTETHVVSFEFLGSYSGEPIEGVPVWLGRDGTGPVAFSGADGFVHFEVNSTTQDWNFGYTYGVGSQRLYSYLNADLSETTVLKLSRLDPGEIVSTHFSSTIVGMKDGHGDEVWANLDGAIEVAYLEDSSPINVSWDIIDPNPSFIAAGQSDDIYGSPSHFNMSLHPQNGETLTLDRTFDKEVHLNLLNPAPSMDTAWNDINLVYGDSGAYVTQYEMPINDPRANAIPVPTLDGELADVALQVVVDLYESNGPHGQFTRIDNVSPGELDVNLPPLHEISTPFGFSSKDLEGASFHIDKDEGDSNRLYYYEVLSEAGYENPFVQYWTVYDYSNDNLHQFPMIPAETGLSWPCAQAQELEGSLYEYFTLSSSQVIHDSEDESVEFATSTLDLDTYIPSSYPPVPAKMTVEQSEQRAKMIADIESELRLETMKASDVTHLSPLFPTQ